MATNNCINLAVPVAKGDLIVGTGTNTNGILSIGTTGQVPTVSGGTLVYQTPSGGTVTTGSSENGTYAVFDATNSTATNLALNGLSSGTNITMSGGGSNTAITINTNAIAQAFGYAYVWGT